MAFNFNWTPLIASTTSPEFYATAKELLSAALSRSAIPSVIVDSHVAIDELDLGRSAPELEVLEIGDIAEDRFRGVFRMAYEGDAAVTLRARMQVRLPPPPKQQEPDIDVGRELADQSAVDVS